MGTDLHNMLYGQDLFLIAGPCAIEDQDMALNIASKIKDICDKLNIHLIFKGSYRKANRTRLDSFTGIGDEMALEILAKVHSTLDLHTITDIHTPQEAEVAARYVQMIQIPAFLCRQTELIIQAAKTGLPVNIKKGQFMSAGAMQHALEKVRSTGNESVTLTERGNSFGYSDLVVDITNIPLMQSYGCPVIMDCTHALQQPNQASGVTGGRPAMIESLAKAATAVGVNGLFIETHPNPSLAKSDGANMLPLDMLESLLSKCLRIKAALK